MTTRPLRTRSSWSRRSARPADAVADAVLADVTRWREAGATAFHVGVAADSFAEYLRRLAWFGREVIARVA